MFRRRRHWKLQVVHPEARSPWVRLVGGNAQITFVTEQFESISNARRAGAVAASELGLRIEEVKE